MCEFSPFDFFSLLSAFIRLENYVLRENGTRELHVQYVRVYVGEHDDRAPREQYARDVVNSSANNRSDIVFTKKKTQRILLLLRRGKLEFNLFLAAEAHAQYQIYISIYYIVVATEKCSFGANVYHVSDRTNNKKKTTILKVSRKRTLYYIEQRMYTYYNAAL